MKFIKSLFFVFLILPIVALNSFATPISILNDSFEEDTPTIDFVYGNYELLISDWESQGTVATWAPTGDMFYGGIPDGKNVAALNGAGSSISQELDWFVNPGNTLTLAVDVGIRSTFTDKPSSAFAIEIWAGENLLTAAGGDVGVLTPGYFETWILSYDINDVNPFIDEQLKIVLTNLGGGYSQLNFDNVHFNNDREDFSVPEPATMLLFGTCLFGLFGMRRRFKK